MGLGGVRGGLMSDGDLCIEEVKAVFLVLS